MDIFFTRKFYEWKAFLSIGMLFLTKKSINFIFFIHRSPIYKHQVLELEMLEILDKNKFDYLII